MRYSRAAFAGASARHGRSGAPAIFLTPPAEKVALGGAGEGVVSPTPAPALKPPLGVSSVPGGFPGDRRARRPSCSSGVRADFPLGKWLLPEKRPDARAAPGGRGPRLPPAGGSGQGPGWPVVLFVPPGPGVSASDTRYLWIKSITGLWQPLERHLVAGAWRRKEKQPRLWWLFCQRLPARHHSDFQGSGLLC